MQNSINVKFNGNRCIIRNILKRIGGNYTKACTIYLNVLDMITAISSNREGLT